MEFHARREAFTGHELAELVAIAPDDVGMRAVRKGNKGRR